MKKEEVRKLIMEKILGNKIGVNVFMSPARLDKGTLIKSWTGEVMPSTNDPIDSYWFAYIDHSPNANFEHPVDYVFINDLTGEHITVHATTPPSLLDKLDKVGGGI